jgi:hypothetical protein
MHVVNRNNVTGMFHQMRLKAANDFQTKFTQGLFIKVKVTQGLLYMYTKVHCVDNISTVNDHCACWFEVLHLLDHSIQEASISFTDILV